MFYLLKNLLKKFQVSSYNDVKVSKLLFEAADLKSLVWSFEAFWFEALNFLFEAVNL